VVFRLGFTALLGITLVVAALAWWNLGLTAPKQVGLAVLALWFIIDARAALRPRRLDAKVYRRVLATVVGTEVLLQVCGVFGWIPTLNVVHHVPYGRVYWAREGFGNSTMNRHGWYYPEPDAAAGKPRVALIGDSFIEAVQIHPSEHLGRHLEGALEGRVTALAFGIYGFGPAHYLELLRYARARWAPADAVIFFCLANDFDNLLPETQQLAPSDYLYYGHPASERLRADLRARLDFNHRPLWQVLPATAASHAFLFSVPHSIVRRASAAGGDGTATEPRSAGAIPPKAFDVMDALLGEYQTLTRSAGIGLTLVTIPNFSMAFYNAPWSSDPLPLERELAKLAAKRGMALIPLGEELRTLGVGAEDIQSLYLWHGTGHLSPEGHAFVGRRLARHFRERQP
jgi:hypothetical protein